MSKTPFNIKISGQQSPVIDPRAIARVIVRYARQRAADKRPRSQATEHKR